MTTSNTSNANQNVTGTNGNNNITTGSGNDRVTALGGNDRINTGAGNDWIDAGAGNDSIDAGSGNDTIYAGTGNDNVEADSGDDWVDAGDGNDNVDGGDGNDTILGGAGNDNLDGECGDDTIDGGDGNDNIDGDDGNDILLGGAGMDNIDGGDGNDRIDGGADADNIDGGSGNDVLLGGAGNDSLEGDCGNDYLDGGSGINRLDGDDGNDFLVYRMSDHVGEGVGSRYSYSTIDGGDDCDTFALALTRDEWLRSDVQSDVARLVAYLRNGGDCRDFVFTAFNLKLDDIENFVVYVDGQLLNPADEGVIARADAITVTEDAPNLAFNLLANDSVPDQVRSVTITNPAKGSVVLTQDYSDPANPVANVVYTPNPTAYQYLAAGERATDTFTYTVTDADGDKSTQTVTVTIVGVNDGPTIVSGKFTGAVTEDAGAMLGTNGAIVFSDVDLTDWHTIAVGPARVAVTGNPPAGFAGANGFGTMSANVVENTTDQNAQGTINWTFNANNAEVQKLAAGQVATQTYTLTLTDRMGATVTQDVTVTLTGTNDGPTIGSATTAGAVTEDGTTAVAGNIAFGDVDIIDTHSVSFVAQGTGYRGTFAASIDNASTGDGAGNVKWAFQADNATLQNLAQGEVLTQRYTVTVKDDNGAATTQVVTVTITGTNDAPVAQADVSAPATEDGAVVTGSVATNDSDVDNGAVLSYTLNAPVAGLTLNADGSYSFNPGNAAYQSLAAGQVQTIVANYTVTDQFGATATSTLTIRVTGTNDAPVAVADTKAVNEDSICTGNVGTNDSDVDQGATRTFALNAPVAGLTLNADGSYSFNAGDAAYQSLAKGQMQTVVANYTVTDDKGATATSTLTITITGTNDAPVAVADTKAVTEDSVCTGNVGTNDSDVDQGATRTFALNAPVAGLTLNADGSYRFDAGNSAYQRLALNEVMTVIAYYTVTDEHGATATATLTITVTGTNDAPVAQPDTATAVEDGALITGSVGGNDSDVDNGATRTFALDAPVAGLTLSPLGAYSFDPGDAAYQSLAAGQVRTVVANYTVTDEHGATATSTLTITITGTNDAPVVTSTVAAASGAVVEAGVANGGDTPDAGIPSATGQLTSSDIDQGATAAWSGSADGTYGAFAISATGAWTYTLGNARAATQALAAGQVVTETFTATVIDDQGATATQVVTITITGTNDRPVVTSMAADAAGAVVEAGVDTPGTIVANGTLTSSDVDQGATALWSGSRDGTYGEFHITADGHWTYGLFNGRTATDALAEGEVVTESFTATVTDEHGGSATQVVTVTITGSNDAPLVTSSTAAGSAAVREAGVATGGDTPEAGTPSATGQLTSSDVDHGATASWSGDANGTYGSFAISASGAWTYALDNARTATQQLAVGETVTETFTATVTDEHGATATQVVTVTISGTNDAPVVTSSTLAASGSVTESGVVTGSDTPDAGTPSVAGQLTSSDVDHGATATWSGNADGTYGAFAIGTDGAWTYTLGNDRAATQALAAGQTVTETFLTTVTDEHGATATQVVTITVTGTNDAPVAIADTGAATEDAAVLTGTVAANDSDVDAGATRTFALNAPVAGLILNADGSYSFDPSNAAYQALARDEVVQIVAAYTVTDEHGATATSTLTITLTGTNDAPVAVADTAAATEDTVVTGTVAANDSDVDNGATRTFALNAPVAGLTLDSDGSYSFDAGNAAYQGLAVGETRVVAAEYTVTDEHGATATATLTITVTGTNDAPVAVADTAAATEDAVLTGTVAANDSDVDTGAVLSFALNAPLAGLTLNADGSYSFDAGNAAYQDLALGQNRVVTATYTVTDQHGGSAQSTLTITLTGTNDAPVAVADTGATTEDTVITGSVAANDSDVDTGAVLSYALDAPVAGLTLNADGSYSFDAGNAAYQSLALGEVATVVASYTVTDEHGATAQSTLTITLTGTNDRPVAVADTAAAVEDQLPVTGSVATNDGDVDNGAVLSYALNAPVAGLTLNANGSYSFDPRNAAYQSLALGQTQVVTASYTVTDEHGATATATLTITVSGANDAPTAQVDVIGAAEDGAVVTGSVAGNDGDVDNGAVLTWALLTPTAGLTLNADGSYSFNPGDAAYQNMALGEVRTVTATYGVTDEHGVTAYSALVIVLTGTNDAPVVTSSAAAAAGTVIEAGNTDGGAVVAGTPSAGGQLTASDIDNGATLAWSGSANGTYGSFAIGANGAWTYALDNARGVTQALAEGQTRTDAFLATVTDQHGATATQLVTVTVVGTNDSPVITSTAAAATGAVTEAGNLDDGTITPGISIATGTLASSDVDSGATATWTGNTNGVYGTFAINPATGAWTYTLDNARAATQGLKEGQSVVETFTATVTDDKGATATQVVTVNVTGTNDAPVAVADTGGGLSGGTTVTFADQTSGGFYSSFIVSNGYRFTSGHFHTYSGPAYPDEGYGTLLYKDSTPIVMTKEGGGSFTLSSFMLGELTRTYTNTTSVTITGTKSDGSTVSTTIALDLFANGPGGANDFQVVTPAGFTDLVSVTFGTASQYFTLDNIVVNAAAGLSTTENAALTIDALANDTDVDAGAVLTIVGATIPAGQGSVSIVANKLVFNPGTDFDYLALGQQTSVVISYTITDEFGATSSSTATVVVTGTNDAPVAVADTNVATEDLTMFGSVATNDSDVDTGAVLTYTLNSAVAGLTLNSNGSYSFNAGNAAYQSLALGQTQVVTATYTVTDQHGATASSTLTITVTGTNDAPVAIVDTRTVAEDATVTGSVATNDSDVDAGAVLTYALTAPVAGLTLNSNGTYSFDANQPGFQSLGVGQSAQVVATYTVTDQHGATATSTLTITVTGTDDLPVLTMSNANNTYVENAASQIVDGALTLVDVDGPNLNGAVVSITGNFNAAQDSLTFTSQYGITGSYNAATGQLTLSGSATAAQYQDVLRSVAYRNNSDNPTTGDRTITYAVTPNGTSSQFYAANGHFYEYVSANGIGWEAARAAAAARTLYGQTGYLATVTSAGENAFITSKLAGSGWIGASDAAVEGQWRWVTGPEAGQLFYTGRAGAGGTAYNGAYNAWAGGEPNEYGSGEDHAHFYANGTWNDFPGNSGVQGYIVEYGGMPGDAALGYTGTAIVKVQAVDDAPVAVADTRAATEDTVVTGTVAANDSDVDSTGLTYALNAQVAGLTLNADGSYSFNAGDAAYQDLAQGQTRVVVANYTVTDPQGATATTMLTITITGTNDAPVAVVDANAATEDTVVTGSVAANDSDIDAGAVLTYSLNAPVAGLTLNADGSYSFNAGDAAYQALEFGQTQNVVATYTVTDQHGATSTATLTIAVAGVADAPIAVADTAAATEDTTITGSVATNDYSTDPSATLSFALNAPIPGLTMNADGSYSFNAGNAAYQSLALGQTLNVVAPYTVTSSNGYTATTTLTITVTGTNDAPAAVADTNAATEDTVVTGSVATNDSDVDQSAVLSYTLNAPVAGLTLNADGSYSFDAGNPSYQNLALGQTRIVTANYTVTDEHGASATNTLTLTVTGTNDAPVAVADVFTAPSGPVAPTTTPVAVPGQILANTVNINTQNDSSIAALGTGYVVVWTDFNGTDGSSTRIAAQRFDAAGQKLGVEFTINTTTANAQQQAAVTQLSNGNFVVTWSDSSATAPDTSGAAVRAQIFTAGGAKVGAEFVAHGIYTSTQNAPTVTALANGGFAIAYADSSLTAPDTSSTAIRLSAFDAVGTRVVSDVLVNTTTSNQQMAPSITTLANGNLVVAWVDSSVTGGDLSVQAVRAQIVTAAGTKVGGEFLVNTQTVNSQVEPSVAALTGGGFVVTWRDSNSSSDGSGVSVKAQLFSATGAKVGTEFLVNTATANNQYLPTVTGLSTGGFVIAWQDDGIEGNLGVRAQLYNASGAKVGSEFGVNLATANAQQQPSVTELADGRLAFSYTDTSSDLNGEVVVRLFNAGGGNSYGENQTLTLDVLANDTDVDSGAVLTLVSASAPSGQGVASVAANKLVFTPGSDFDYLAAGETADVVVTYTIRDQHGATASTTATITINGTNDLPVAVADTTAATEDTVVTGSVATNDSDLDHNAVLTYALSAPVAGLTLNADGTYSFDAGNAAYQNLGAGATRTVVANYNVTDDKGGTASSALTITVTGTNDAPVVGNVTLLANRLGNGGFDITPDFSGWTINTTSTGTSAVQTATAVINRGGTVIAGDNAVAVLNYSATVPTPYGTGYGPSITSAAFQGNAGDKVRFVYKLDSGGDYAVGTGYIRDAATGQIVQTIFNYQSPVVGSTGVQTVELTLASTGSYTIDFRVGSYDASGGQAIGATMYIGFAGILADGIGEDAPFTFNTGRALLTANASDVDVGDVLTIAAFTTTSNLGAAVTMNAAGELTVTPTGAVAIQALKAGERATDTFTYTVSDGKGGLTTATASYTLIGTNDAPIAVADTGAVNEDAILTGSVAANDSDVDHDAVLTYTMTSAPIVGLTFNADGSYSFDAGHASYRGMVAGEVRTVVASYRVTDELGAFATATLTITVTGTNDVPVAVADTRAATEDTTVTGSVATNDSDADAGATLSYTLNTPVAGLTLNADGSYSFDAGNAAYQALAVGQIQTVVASYTVSDGQGGSATSTLTITITGTNDAPVAVADTGIAAEDAIVSGSVATNDSDADAGTALAYTLVAPVAGLTLNTDGSYSFDAGNAAYQYLNTGQSTVVVANYTVSDGQGGTATSALSITVSGSNDGPVATNLSTAETYIEDTPLNLTDIVVTDPDTATVTVTLRLSDVSAGALSTGTSGSVTSTYNAATGVWTASGAPENVNTLLAGVVFTPAPNKSGSFTLATSVSDGVATVTGSKAFTGVSVNDAPAGADRTITLTEDGSRTLTATDFGFTDSDGNTFAGVRIAALPGAGTLRLDGTAVTAGQIVSAADIAAGKLVFAPAANGNGTGYASFTFQVQDNGGTANGGIDIDASANTLTFNVTATNDPVTDVGLSANVAPENVPSVTVGVLSASDGDVGETFTYTIRPGLDGSLFTIVGNELRIGGTGLDYEQATTRQVIVRATDAAGSFFERTFTIQVSDSNEFTLTTGNDAVSFGNTNDQVLGNSLTLNAGDSIVTGAGADELLLFGSGTFNLNTVAAYSGVETVRLINLTTNMATLTLRNGVANDVSVSGTGATTITLNDQASTVTGGDGGDVVTTGTGSAVINTGNGNDTVTTGNGNATVTMGTGSDTIAINGSGTVSVDTGTDNDTILHSGSGAATIIAGFGADTIRLGNGLANVDAGADGDTIFLDQYGYNAGQTINGGLGSDQLVVNGNRDLTTLTLSNLETLNLQGSAALVTSAAQLAQFVSLTGTLTSRITIADAALDWTGKTLTNTTLYSSNVTGTLFKVSSAAAALQIFGGDGNDTVQVVGAALTADQRDVLFAVSSIETLIDSSGTYTAPPASPGLIRLTAGNDTVVANAGDSTVNATATTLTAGDVLAGGGGTDVLAIYGQGSFNLNSINVTGYEQVRLINNTTSDSSLVLRTNETTDVVATGTGRVIVQLNNMMSNVTTAGGNDVVYMAGGGAANISTGIGTDSIYMGSGLATINAGSDNDTIYVDWYGFNGSSTIDGGTGTLDHLYVNSNRDLRGMTLLNVESIQTSGTTIISTAQLAPLTRLLGGGVTSYFSFSESVVDLSNKTIQNVNFLSTNATGTTFKVNSQSAALYVQGGAGNDTLDASTVTLSAIDREIIFAQGSIETIIDATGTYSAPVDPSRIKLTTGADTLPALPDSQTIIATSATLNANDNLAAGNTGTDELRLYGGGSFNLSTMSGFSGFELVTIVNNSLNAATVVFRAGAPTTLVSNSNTQVDVYANDAASNITGGAGSDYVRITNGNSSLNLGNGNDIVWMQGTASIVADMGTGNDTAYLGTGIANIDMGANDDTVQDTYGLGAGSVINGGIGFDYMYIANNRDLTTVSVSNFEYFYVNSTTATVKMSAAQAVQFQYLVGQVGGKITTDDAVFDMTGKSVSGIQFLSGNATGTLFKVSASAAGFQVVGGSGQDGVEAVGFTFTADQRTALLNGASVEYIVEGNTIYGGNGNNTLNGTAANNTIYGNGGNDTIDGGAGSDILYGGDGNDVFVFDMGETNGDSVLDFSGNGTGAGDSLVFRGFGAGATFTQVDATHWKVASADGLTQETLTVSAGTTFHSTDVTFFP